MGENTKIAWCDHTFNPWRGCTKVSAGCDNCYAEGQAKRNPTVLGIWGGDGLRVVAKDWYSLPRRWNREAAETGRPALVFPSMMDPFEVFEGEVRNHRGSRLYLHDFEPNRWVADYAETPDERGDYRPLFLGDCRRRLWELIGETRRLKWLLLTKRPENVARLVPVDWLGGRWPENVAIGVSIENQKVAEERLFQLSRIPAAMRFVSCEPLIGPVILKPEYLHGIAWIIAGGESGRKARPMHVDWVSKLRDQAQRAGCAFFFKQWGEYQNGSDPSKKQIYVLNDGTIYRPGKVPSPSGRCFDRKIDQKHVECWGQYHATVMTRVGKKNSGRKLDGQEWLEFPAWCGK